MNKQLQAFLEADATKCSCNACYGKDAVSEHCEAGQSLHEERQELQHLFRELLADMEKMGEGLLEGIITECEIEWQNDDGSWADDTPTAVRKLFAIAHSILALTEKWRGL